jgi:hypothetical protein
MAQDEKSIIRSLLDPTIALDEISWDDSEEGTNINYVEASNKPSKNVGNNFPLIKINEYQVADDELERLFIDSTGFLPEITITFGMASPTTFLSRAMPKDGDKINLFIRARDDAFKPIRNDYLITNVDTTMSQNSQGEGMTVTLTGELFIPRFNDEVIKAYTGTSYDVLQTICEELGMGFASNDESTDDDQTWICANDNLQGLIQHITDSSWKDEASFFHSYIDVYYHLNFINANNQFTESTEIDMALVDTLLSDDSLGGEEVKMSEDKKLFTNIQDKSGTNMFIKNYKLINSSSDISKRFGYKMHSEFFEHNSLEKWDIFSEPLIVEGSAEDKILFKGRAGEDWYKTQVKRRWSGMQYTLPEHNVHEKYLYARVHNLMNIQELNKMNVSIQVPRANFNIYRGERIPCIFLSSGTPMKTTFLQQEAEIEAAGENESFSESGAPTLDKFYSGFYMILGMTFTYLASNPQAPSQKGFFTEEVILTRRTWPTP